MNTQQESVEFDVVIVGDGLAGLAMAVSLLTHNDTRHLRVGLVSQNPLSPVMPANWDLRVYAVAKPLESLLRTSGAWQLMQHRASQAIERMVIWDQKDSVDDKQALVFNAAEMGVPRLGFILEQVDMRAALWQRATELGCLFGQFTDMNCSFNEKYVSINGEAIHWRARLLVAADGRDSVLRQQSGIDFVVKSYEQTAIVAHFASELSHRDTAWQRFCNTGPLALLPLANQQVSCVYSLPHSLAGHWLTVSDHEFAQQVTQASDAVLGELNLVSKRESFPLRFAQASRYYANRLVLVADAAHNVHPLAGQGINQGILDVLSLTNHLADAIKHGRDVGESAALMAYSRERSTLNAIMGHGIDAMYELFQSQSTVMSLARRCGFAGLNRLPWLRAMFAHQAMGMTS